MVVDYLTRFDHRQPAKVVAVIQSYIQMVLSTRVKIGRKEQREQLTTTDSAEERELVGADV